MALKTLRLSDLRTLAPDARRQRLSEFAAARHQPLNGELSFVAESIAAFEQRYEMRSAVMLEGLQNGSIKETADIGNWLMLLDVREHLGTK